MEKNKNRVFKLLGLLVVVFLVCLCMLGSTFARYTTGGEGKATAEVAEWDVTAVGTAHSTDVTIGKLSPMLNNGNSTSASDYNNSNSGGNGYKYVNIIYAKVATITITKIDVDAELQLTYGGVTINGTGNTGATLESDSTYTSSSDWISTDDTSGTSGITSSALGNDPTWAQVIGSSGALQFNVGYINSTSSNDSTIFDSDVGDLTDDSNKTIGYGYEQPTGLTSLIEGTTTTVKVSATSTATSYDVYAWVTWTSDYSGSNDADVVDAIDTWIGMNVESVSATITCKLVQASTVTTNGSGDDTSSSD